jgi:hypothetical protein
MLVGITHIVSSSFSGEQSETREPRAADLGPRVKPEGDIR